MHGEKARLCRADRFHETNQIVHVEAEPAALILKTRLMDDIDMIWTPETLYQLTFVIPVDRTLCRSITAQVSIARVQNCVPPMRRPCHSRLCPNASAV